MWLRTGMTIEKVHAILRGSGADNITDKVNLPREALGPFEKMESYRLQSGTVLEIYSRPAENNFSVYLIAVSADRLGRPISNMDPLRKKKLDLHFMLVDEFDLEK
jgi:hypothetical protein